MGIAMGTDIGLDIAALILLGILFTSSILRRMTNDISNRIFLLLIFVVAASDVFDIISVLLDRNPNADIHMLYMTHLGYLVMHFLTAPVYLLFFISLVDTWHKLKKDIFLQIVMIAPSLVMLAAFILNTSTGLVFSVDNGYAHGPWFSLMYINTIIYVIFDVVCLTQYRELFSLEDIIALVAVMLFARGGMLTQMLVPNNLIEMFCGSVSLLILSIYIQRPEDYVDSVTRLMKHSAYARDMKRTYYNDKHVTVIMLNIGNYDSVKSMIGFDPAMELLKKVAGKVHDINKKLHGHAWLYYLDNGRFRIVFSGKSIKRVDAVAEELNRQLKQPMNFNGFDITLSPFIVIARCPEDMVDFKMLMSFGADFHKKNYYTGSVMRAGDIYSKNQLDIQTNMDAIIESALANDRFQVYYQPIYSITQDRFVSAEALIRLIDPDHGYISPEAMITAAERNGAIHKIGEIVFEKVCQFIASDDFDKLGLDYIEVNLSVAQIMNSDLPDVILSTMKKYNVSPDKINLEITETAAAYAQDVMTENLDKLTKAGLSFSLDDYGTGYSNMQRVIQLPLKIIKLDKSFVDENNNPKMWIFLENTVKMLKDMKMEIVVEGVETQEMLDAFSDLKCDFIQGYFFSKPIPKSDFVAFIADANKAS